MVFICVHSCVQVFIYVFTTHRFIILHIMYVVFIGYTYLFVVKSTGKTSLLKKTFLSVDLCRESASLSTYRRLCGILCTMGFINKKVQVRVY